MTSSGLSESPSSLAARRAEINPSSGSARRCSAEPLQDRVELARRGDGPHCVCGRATAQSDDESLHEHVELVPVLVADAQHRRDDRQRQRDSHVVDQVDRLAAPLFHLVQQLGHDALDLAGHLLHPARRERLVHQPAQPGMVGIVLVDHAAHEQPEHAGQVSHQEAGALAGGIAREPHVVVQQHDVLVPRQHVAGTAEQLLGVGAGHRRRTSQLGVARVGVGEHDGVGEVGRVELSGRCGVGHRFPGRSLTRGSRLLTSNSAYSIRPRPIGSGRRPIGPSGQLRWSRTPCASSTRRRTRSTPRRRRRAHRSGAACR